MTSYRTCNSQDRPALCRLWCRVFGDEEAWVERFLTNIPSLVSRGAFANSRLVSALHLIPCRLMGGEVPLSGYYLYAAATDPSYRAQGLMANLLRNTAESCRAQLDFICLYPAEESLYAYYARFGYLPLFGRAHYGVSPMPVRRFAEAGSWKKTSEGAFFGKYISFDEKVYAFLLREDPESAVFPMQGADGCFLLPMENAAQLGGDFTEEKGGMLLPLSEQAKKLTAPLYLGLTME